MYLELEEGKSPLINQNLYIKNDSTSLYLFENNIYKLCEKFEPYKRHKLDYLIGIRKLDDFGILPLQKFRTNLGRYGYIMRYVSNSCTWLNYISQTNVHTIDVIEKIVALSDGLKMINSCNIKFSDLHHNNILLDGKGKPLFIDFDDAVINNFTSYHICYIAYYLHDIGKFNKDYKQRVIQYANLDRECLFILFLDFLFGIELEKKNYEDFQIFLSNLRDYFNKDFIYQISQLKTREGIIHEFNYYIGDILKDDEIQKQCYEVRSI